MCITIKHICYNLRHTFYLPDRRRMTYNLYACAVKLIAPKIKGVLNNVCTVYIYVYINTNTYCTYLESIHMYIFFSYLIYKYKLFLKYIYINRHTVLTLCKQKLLFWMRFNHWTAFKYIYIDCVYICILFFFFFFFFFYCINNIVI